MKSKSSFIFSYSAAEIIINLQSSTSVINFKASSTSTTTEMKFDCVSDDHRGLRMTFEEKSTLFLDNKRSKFKVKNSS